MDSQAQTDQGVGPAPALEPTTDRGRELEFIPTNFTISTEQRIAAAGGAPSWSRRARELEDAIERFWNQVSVAYETLREEVAGRREFSSRWQQEVDALELHVLASMADNYNRWFPVEANLPMDPATGDFVFRGGPFQRAAAPSRGEVLERFPAERE